MWIFICFNFAMVFLGTWVHLGGARKIKTMFSPKARKANKEMAGRRNGDKA
jgi:ATP-binding cassette subfamily G (WHITE) protein 2 (SNQ2)